MPSYRDELLYLSDILESGKAIKDYITHVSFEIFSRDRKTFSATIRELEIIGEAVGKLSKELKSKYPDVLWRDIKDFRNKIIHEYFGIDARIVWDVITTELPRLLMQVEKMYKK